jgi:recA bacterial DNA recombination protein
MGAVSLRGRTAPPEPPALSRGRMTPPEPPALSRGRMTPSQLPAIEQILEGSGLERKAAARDLLTGIGAKLTRASELAPRGAAREILPTKVSALDRLLSGGLPRGALVEVTGRRSCGRFAIGLSSLAAATSAGESAAFVDLGGHLDPQSAEESGVDLSRLLWVRPSKLKEAVASAEMLLGAGFPLVVVDLGVPPVRGRSVPDAAWVRLTRAARDRRAALLLLSPYRVSGVAAESAIAAGAARALWRGTGRSPRLLEGVASKLTLQKDPRARGGEEAPVSLRVTGERAGTSPAPTKVSVGAALAAAR